MIPDRENNITIQNKSAALIVDLFGGAITDFHFKKDLKVTIQDIGWRHGGRYLREKSDISSTAFWYQSEPHESFPDLPAWEDLEVN